VRVRQSAVALVLVLVCAACNWRGPAPSDATIEAALGSFEIDTVSVAPRDDFGGGTIYFPTTTSVRFGGVAVVPGYTETQDSVAWLGPRLASQGFVVIVIDTLSVYDPPIARSEQLLAALDYLTTESAVVDRVDAERLAVVGWSMGGGGALLAARARTSLKAAIPLAPWSPTKSFSTLAVPTLIVGCEDDLVAPVAENVDPIWPTLPASLPRAYLEIAGANHFCVTSTAPASSRTTIIRSVLPWLKRHVDSDTRYNPWLCPPPSGPTISEYRSDCAA